MDDIVVRMLADTLPALGVGGLLALVIFYFHRKDQIHWMKLHQDNTERLEKLTESFRSVVEENTRAITVLAERINRMR